MHIAAVFIIQAGILSGNIRLWIWIFWSILITVFLLKISCRKCAAGFDKTTALWYTYAD